MSHFVKRGAFPHRRFLLQPNTPGDRTRPKVGSDQSPEKQVFASAVSRYVFKQGRKTFPPEQMLVECGLLPSKDMDKGLAMWSLIEERRKRDLEAA